MVTTSTRFANSLSLAGGSMGLGLTPSVAFPVVFCDGKEERDVGSVMVDGNLQFSMLLSNICSKIGMAPNQISLYLVRKKKARTWDGKRKVPIDEGSDFSSIARERDCFLLVKARRSGRKAKGARRNDVVPARSWQEKARATSNSQTITRTNARQRENTKTILPRPSPGLFGTGFWRYEAAPMVPFDMAREMCVIPASPQFVPHGVVPYESVFPANYLRPSSTYVAPAVCKICAEEAGGSASEFHCCANDAVVTGFRSIFGPIQRPDKKA